MIKDELALEFGGEWHIADDDACSFTCDTVHGEKLVGFLQRYNVPCTVERSAESTIIAFHRSSSRLLELAFVVCDKFRKPKNTGRTVQSLLAEPAPQARKR